MDRGIEWGPFRGAQYRMRGPEASTFDVIVIGAGPAGSTLAYFLAQHSKGVFAGTPLRIAILEKSVVAGKDKYCGDVRCRHALCRQVAPSQVAPKKGS